jgi:hypothetical protein
MLRAGASSFISISGDPSMWFGPLGCFLLMFTPGAWFTFAFTLPGVQFWARLFTGAMLSPLILCAEFYPLRLAGMSFGTTAIVLVFLNFPVLYFVWKRRGRWASLGAGDWLVGVAAVVIPIACMIPILTSMEARIFSPHSWYHADLIYEFARGNLVIESPTLAGLRLPYPVWTPLVASTVKSFLLDSPPVRTYVWGNLLELIAVSAFAAGIAGQVGGGKLAQFTAGIWLLLGTNPIGYILIKVAPSGMAHQLWGDWRYTPWVSKFGLLSPMTLALGMFMALIYFLIPSGPLTNGHFLVIGLLLSGVGLVYPLLFPPACGLIVARAIAPLIGQLKRQWSYREWLAWAGLALIAVLLTYGEIKFMTSARQVSSGMVLLSAPASAARKAIASLIATSLLLAGLAFTFRERWKDKPAATAFLVCGALFSYVLYAVFFIPYYENEYKFVFSVAMCLAPFPAIAAEKIWRQWPRVYAVPLIGGMTILLAGCFAHFTYVTWPSPWLWQHARFEKNPQVDLSHFRLKLNQPAAWGGICEAVWHETPPNSVLLLDDNAVYYPAFMDRSLFVSASSRLYPGVNLLPDEIDGDLRGYGHDIIKERRAILADFFAASDDARRDQAFDAVHALHRPVAIVTEPRHAALIEWLGHRKDASRLDMQDGLSLWLMDDARAIRRSASTAATDLPSH